MDNIPVIADRMRTILTHTADSAAYRTRFTQRRSKLTGALFVQTLVLGWLHNPSASLEALAQMGAILGVDISPQGLDKRFSPKAADLLKQVLDVLASQMISAAPTAIPILQRFTAVILQDSSTIALPNALDEEWQGCGGNPGQGKAAVKIQLRLDVSKGTLQGPLLQDGRSQDRSSPFQRVPVPEGALRIADLGFFSLDVLQDIAEQGAFFLSRLQVQTVLLYEDNSPLDLMRVLPKQVGDAIDIPVQIGSMHRIRGRLLAVRVPKKIAMRRRAQLRVEARRRGQRVSKARLALADWTILVTNAQQELLSLEEALVLARVRWQIELLFKLWKHYGQIDEWRSTKPWRILSEVYAKLAAMVIQHWILLTSCWEYPDKSLVKSARLIRTLAPMLALALGGATEISLVIEYIRQCLRKGCRMNKRRKNPNTYQLLLALSDAA